MNLRIVDRTRNNMNHYINSNNTSGVTGVSRDKSGWRARINLYGKEIYLGRYRAIEDASLARKIAEERFFGDYRPIKKG